MTTYLMPVRRSDQLILEETTSEAETKRHQIKLKDAKNDIHWLRIKAVPTARDNIKPNSQTTSSESS